MNASSHKFQRSNFLKTITVISLMRTAQNPRLDFWGPVALVVTFGFAGRLIQALLTN